NRYEANPEAKPAVDDDDARAERLLACAAKLAFGRPDIAIAVAHRKRPPRDVADMLEPALKLAGRDAFEEAFLAYTWQEIEEGNADYKARTEEQANRALELAVAENDRNAQALALAARGNVRRVLGQAKEGLADLEAALKLDPHHPNVWVWKARALEALGREADAAEANAEAEERGRNREAAIKAILGKVYSH